MRNAIKEEGSQGTSTSFSDASVPSLSQPLSNRTTATILKCFHLMQTYFLVCTPLVLVSFPLDAPPFNTRASTASCSSFWNSFANNLRRRFTAKSAVTPSLPHRARLPPPAHLCRGTVPWHGGYLPPLPLRTVTRQRRKGGRARLRSAGWVRVRGTPCLRKLK